MLNLRTRLLSARSRAKKSDGERDKDAIGIATTGRTASDPSLYALRETHVYDEDAD